MISLKGVCFSYTPKKKLFQNLNLDLRSGHIYGLLGRNGAGKTTLLKMLAGLLYPQAGGCDVLGFNPSKRYAEMLADLFFIPEDCVLPDMAIERFVRIHGSFYPRFHREGLMELLEEFELDYTKKLGSFSFGQKKKFSLAFGLAAGTGLLIMDEPTNGLDIPSKRQFRKIMAGQVSENRTVIISTHQVRDLEHLIEAVIVLDNGSIVVNRTMDDLTQKLKVEKCNDKEQAEAALYDEKVIDGYITVVENSSGEPGHIDMELLFNTIVANRDRIENVLSEGGAR